MLERFRQDFDRHTWLVGETAEGGRLRKSFVGPVPNPAKPLGEDGSCVRRSRVVLASVADVKPAETRRPNRASDNSQSAGDGDKNEFVAGKSTYKP